MRRTVTVSVTRDVTCDGYQNDSAFVSLCCCDGLSANVDAAGPGLPNLQRSQQWVQHQLGAVSMLQQ